MQRHKDMRGGRVEPVVAAGSRAGSAEAVIMAAARQALAGTLTPRTLQRAAAFARQTAQAASRAAVEAATEADRVEETADRLEAGESRAAGLWRGLAIAARRRQADAEGHAGRAWEAARAIAGPAGTAGTW